MAHCMSTNEMPNKVDCTQMGDASDAASTTLLVSGFTTPAQSKEHEIKALRSANCELQARLSGYLVLPQMMEKKAKECKHWKLRALKAERQSKLISSILTESQLEELHRWNVVPPHDESPLQSDISADSSLESFQTISNSCDIEIHLAHVADSGQQYKSDDLAPQNKVDSKNVTIDTDNVDLLKQQIATYIEDFENERKDRERLVAVCDQQRRDLQVLRAEKKSVFQQLRQVEDELHLLRQDNAAMKCNISRPHRHEANYVRSCGAVVVTPEIVSVQCTKLPTAERRETTLSVDGPRLL